MNSIVDPWTDSGQLLNAVLEGWIVAEISDATTAEMQPRLPTESRRRQGIQSVRGSQASVSDRYRASR
jgi:predicted amidohydrolase